MAHGTHVCEPQTSTQWDGDIGARLLLTKDALHPDINGENVMHKNGTGSIETKLDSLKESVRNLVDAGGERAGQLKTKAIDVKDSVVENGGAALRKTGSLIKDHPIAAIAIAFGVGYIAIRLLKK